MQLVSVTSSGEVQMQPPEQTDRAEAMIAYAWELGPDDRVLSRSVESGMPRKVSSAAARVGYIG